MIKVEIEKKNTEFVDDDEMKKHLSDIIANHSHWVVPIVNEQTFIIFARQAPERLNLKRVDAMSLYFAERGAVIVVDKQDAPIETFLPFMREFFGNDHMNEEEFRDHLEDMDVLLCIPAPGEPEAVEKGLQAVMNFLAWVSGPEFVVAEVADSRTPGSVRTELDPRFGMGWDQKEHYH